MRPQKGPQRKPAASHESHPALERRHLQQRIEQRRVLVFSDPSVAENPAVGHHRDAAIAGLDRRKNARFSARNRHRRVRFGVHLEGPPVQCHPLGLRSARLR